MPTIELHQGGHGNHSESHVGGGSIRKINVRIVHNTLYIPF